MNGRYTAPTDEAPTECQWLKFITHLTQTTALREAL